MGLFHEQNLSGNLIYVWSLCLWSQRCNSLQQLLVIVVIFLLLSCWEMQLVLLTSAFPLHLLVLARGCASLRLLCHWIVSISGLKTTYHSKTLLFLDIFLQLLKRSNLAIFVFLTFNYFGAMLKGTNYLLTSAHWECDECSLCYWMWVEIFHYGRVFWKPDAWLKIWLPILGTQWRIKEGMAFFVFTEKSVISPFSRSLII